MEKKILIVDDDVKFAEVLKDVLMTSRYDVTAVTDGINAIKAARRIKPDLILLDLKMRRLSGIETAAELKKYSRTCDIPLIAVSGYFGLEEDSWVKNFCGFENFLKKPFDPQEILAKIEKIFEKK